VPLIPLLITVIISAHTCAAEVLHVPADYPTIQSALDTLESGDTVLVEMGEYGETLIAPLVPFTLLGNVAIDTGDFLRPVIDPYLLPPTERDRCLIMPDGSNGHFENIRFRNRAVASAYTHFCGINLAAAMDSAIFLRCAFDSLFGGIGQPDSSTAWPDDSLQGILVIEECLFRNDSLSGIAMQNGPLLATNCFFHGTSDWGSVWCGPNSAINDCSFQGGEFGWYISAVGQNTRIDNCIFGHNEMHRFPPLELVNFSGSVTNCVFTDIDLYTIGCMTIEVIALGSVIVANNVFMNIYAPHFQSKTGIVFEGDCNPNDPVLFENNVIVDCSTTTAPKALGVRTCVSMRGNRIINNQPQSRWAVYVFHAGSLTAERNIFSGNGVGMHNQSPDVVDARDNWWGDSTGPRASTNPVGLGDSVSDNILYEPWTTDTNDWLAVEEMPVIPESFEMSVFPNPFNSTATLLLRVPEPTIVRIELFDVMGRQIREIFSGAVAIEQKINFNAADLPSGVYFARAMDVHFHRQLVAAKLLLIR
jgi:hypothetical protein